MKKSNILSALLLGSIIGLSGCGGDMAASSSQGYAYEVQVTNVTAGQPMSPLLVSSTSFFSVGESASAALEKLAEGGDNSELLNADSVSGSKLITPSQSDAVSVNTLTQTLSIATMLVKTNDAFAGLDNQDLSSLALNASATFYLNAYDAGTEENSETNATVPGLGEEGYNSARESSDIVTLHAGIITKDDGLATSNLSSMEKFNNPVARVVITRTK